MPKFSYQIHRYVIPDIYMWQVKISASNTTRRGWIKITLSTTPWCRYFILKPGKLCAKVNLYWLRLFCSYIKSILTSFLAAKITNGFFPLCYDTYVIFAFIVNQRDVNLLSHCFFAGQRDHCVCGAGAILPYAEVLRLNWLTYVPDSITASTSLLFIYCLHKFVFFLLTPILLLIRRVKTTKRPVNARLTSLKASSLCHDIYL